MAITLPFDFIEKTGNPVKITKEQDVETWINIQDTINNLVARCNSANGTSYSLISLINQDSKSGFLIFEEYDENITKIQNTLNTIIGGSESQGLNPSNTFVLYKRGAQVAPLYIWQRDTNLRTIQTVINSIHNMYIWVGA
jgi:hypothetical protein